MSKWCDEYEPQEKKRYNRKNSDGSCTNMDCNKRTKLRYCSDCYKDYQSRKQECINDKCTMLTVSRYCRDCRISYRRKNHFCESCKDIITERKWCKDCYNNFGCCAIEICDKKVQPRFNYCWDHFQESINPR
jgi:hypothetical protein